MIWPEHAARRRLAEAAIAVLLRDPPRLVKGDATRVLEAQLEDVPPDTLLVVYNSAALCQGGVADQNAVRSVLAAFSGRRRGVLAIVQNEEVLLRTLDNGHMMELKLANKDGHGRWLEWL